MYPLDKLVPVASFGVTDSHSSLMLDYSDGAVGCLVSMMFSVLVMRRTKTSKNVWMPFIDRGEVCLLAKLETHSHIA